MNDKELNEWRKGLKEENKLYLIIISIWFTVSVLVFTFIPPENSMPCILVISILPLLALGLVYINSDDEYYNCGV